MLFKGFEILTGKPCKHLILKDFRNKLEEELEDLWNELVEYYQKKYFIGCGIDPKDEAINIENYVVKNLPSKHAYFINDIVLVSGNRLLKIRNP
jgi:hypothetical protein